MQTVKLPTYVTRAYPQLTERASLDCIPDMIGTPSNVVTIPRISTLTMQAAFINYDDAVRLFDAVTAYNIDAALYKHAGSCCWYVTDGHKALTWADAQQLANSHAARMVRHDR